MIFIIRFGFKESGDFLGYTAEFCHFCETAQPFAAYDISRAAQINSLTVGRSSLHSKRLACTLCYETIDLDLNSTVAIEREWQPAAGFQALVDATRPDMGVMPTKLHLSTPEVRAMLTRSTEWARYSFHNEGNAGCLVGLVALLALVVGGFLGNAMSPAVINPASPPTNYTIIFGVPFAVAVSLAAYFLLRRNGLSKLLASRLHEAGAAYRITPAMYEMALSTMKPAPQLTRSAVGRLRSAQPN